MDTIQVDSRIGNTFEGLELNWSDYVDVDQEK